MTSTSAADRTRRGTPDRTVRSATRRGRAVFAAAAVCLGAWAAVGAQPAAAQETDEPSVWDGVYSAAQAQRGRKLY